jgi:aspartyl/glutamyl-tRNA(Asn/Gln) amidotransferase C subunit
MSKAITVNIKLIDRLTYLAHLPLTDSQKKKLIGELSDILSYAGKVQNTDTKNIKETAQVTGLSNIIREDKLDTKRSLTQKQALQNTSSVFNNYFKVPATIDHES